jgi:hypothetical protein
MRKSIFIMTIGIIILSAFALEAGTVDLSGDWELTTVTQRGERTSTITIVQEGEKITVTMPGRRGGDPTTAEGTIDGDKIEWTITRETPRGEMTSTFKGTVSGDSMSGTSEMGGRGMTMEWTAKKV